MIDAVKAFKYERERFSRYTRTTVSDRDLEVTMPRNWRQNAKVQVSYDSSFEVRTSPKPGSLN